MVTESQMVCSGVGPWLSFQQRWSVNVMEESVPSRCFQNGEVACAKLNGQHLWKGPVHGEKPGPRQTPRP